LERSDEIKDLKMKIHVLGLLASQFRELGQIQQSNDILQQIVVLHQANADWRNEFVVKFEKIKQKKKKS